MTETFNLQDFLLPGEPENQYDYQEGGSNTQSVDLSGNGTIDDNDVFTYPSDKNILDNPTDIFNIIDYHSAWLAPKYKVLSDYAKGRHHTIIDQDAQSTYESDNRSIVNFPKKLTDSFNGYDTGNPIQASVKSGDDETDNNATDMINSWLNQNDYGDNFSELNRKASIYGRSYLYLYPDGNTFSMTSCTPLDTIVVYDDTVAQRPLFAIRYETGTKDHQYDGTLITKEGDYSFNPVDDNNGNNISLNNGPKRTNNPTLPSLPVIEMVENNGRVSIFGDCINLIDSTNDILSQKNNDLHALSQGYLVIKGVNMSNQQKNDIAKRHLINLHRKNSHPQQGNDSNVDPSAQFISPQINDTMQEHTLDRNISLIYQSASVVDLNDPQSGVNSSSNSGTALKQLYQGMKSKADSKDSKFDKLFAQALTIMFQQWGIDDSLLSSVQIRHKHADISDIAQSTTAIKNLQGTKVPLDYQFSLLPGVDDPKGMADQVNQNEQQSNQQNQQSVQQQINQSIENMRNRGVPNGDPNGNNGQEKNGPTDSSGQSKRQ